MNHKELLDELTTNIPESWASSEGSMESIICEYVHALENRIRELVDCTCIFEREYSDVHGEASL